MTNPILEAIDTLSEPSEMVRWLMRAGPVAERLNRDSKLDVFRANLIPSAPTPPFSTKGTGAGQETASSE